MPIPSRSDFLKSVEARKAAQAKPETQRPAPARPEPAPSPKAQAQPASAPAPKAQARPAPRPQAQPKPKTRLSSLPPAQGGAWDFSEPETAHSTSDVKTRKRLRLTERDVDIMAFLVRYRFATRAQIEARLGVSNLCRRLKQLKEAGYLAEQVMMSGFSLWITTSAGIQVTGMTTYKSQVGSVRGGSVAHALGLVNIGSDLEMGRTDRLWLPDDLLSAGPEHVIHDRDISTSYHEEVMAAGGNPKRAKDTYLERWGEEPWTYVVHSSTASRNPDLVLDRGGKGKDVAIELELSPKTQAEYDRIMDLYKASPYRAVVWLTDKRKIATLIGNATRKAGAEHKVYVQRYAPVHTNLNYMG